MEPVCLADWELLARDRVSQAAWGYYAAGAEDGVTLRENRAAFERIALHYRVLVDVTERSLATTVLGCDVAFPIVVAPTAFHGLAHPDAERATVRGAHEAGTAFTLSTLSNTEVEDVVAATSGPVWFQLYVYADRGVTEALVRRAEAAGCRAILVTVDAPLLGRREVDIRGRFGLPEHLEVAHLHGTHGAPLPPDARGSGLARHFVSLIDRALTWRDLDWLAGLTSLPIVLKGVVRADDADRAVRHGVAGLVVSNHGGRQLDGSPATISVLPEIAEAVDGRCELLLDGGVRRGTDVLKALALGARAVMVGRPVLWGLAVDGSSGVRRVLHQLRDELDHAMALAGVTDVRQVPRDLVRMSGGH